MALYTASSTPPLNACVFPAAQRIHLAVVRQGYHAMGCRAENKEGRGDRASHVSWAFVLPPPPPAEVNIFSTFLFAGGLPKLEASSVGERRDSALGLAPLCECCNARQNLLLSFSFAIHLFFVALCLILGEGRDRPRRYPDVGFDAHVADAHGSPSRHVPGTFREYGTDVDGSVRSFRTFRLETGQRKSSLRQRETIRNWSWIFVFTAASMYCSTTVKYRTDHRFPLEGLDVAGQVDSCSV